MSFDLDNTGPRETHLESDGTVTVGGRLDEFGTEQAIGPGDYDTPEHDGGYEPAPPEQYDAEGRLDATIQEALRPFDDYGLDELFEPQPTPDLERASNAVVSPEDAEAVYDLIAERPEIGTETVKHAIAPALNRIAEIFGPRVALDPQVVESVYEEMGGDERFGRAAYEEREISGMFGEQPGLDAFT